MIHGTPFYVAYLTPIIVIILANFIVMNLSLAELFRKNAATQQHKLSAGRRLRIVVSCSVLMGITWILGVFAIGKLTFTFQLLFTIFNSLQGLFIFVFYCALNKDAVKEWRRVLGCAAQEPMTSTGKATQDGVKRGSGVFKSKSVESDENVGKDTEQRFHMNETVNDAIEKRDSADVMSPANSRFPVYLHENADVIWPNTIHVNVNAPESLLEKASRDDEVTHDAIIENQLAFREDESALTNAHSEISSNDIELRSISYIDHSNSIELKEGSDDISARFEDKPKQMPSDTVGEDATDPPIAAGVASFHDEIGGLEDKGEGGKRKLPEGKINRDRSKTEKRVYRGNWNFSVD